jgi:single-stranded DNA-specific DHH superfamily exonuclease
MGAKLRMFFDAYIGHKQHNYMDLDYQNFEWFLGRVTIFLFLILDYTASQPKRQNSSYAFESTE